MLTIPMGISWWILKLVYIIQHSAKMMVEMDIKGIQDFNVPTIYKLYNLVLLVFVGCGLPYVTQLGNSNQVILLSFNP